MFGEEMGPMDQTKFRTFYPTTVIHSFKLDDITSMTYKEKVNLSL